MMPELASAGSATRRSTSANRTRRVWIIRIDILRRLIAPQLDAQGRFFPDMQSSLDQKSLSDDY